jgi:arylsulfatase
MIELTRRSFLCSLTAAALPVSAATLSTEAGQKRPNILVIMADDMGFSDLGCYGSEIATPNINSLAERGVRFTHFYNCARCCPSRASLLTGLDNHAAGVGDMVQDRGPGPYQGFLNQNCVTLAEALRPAGYHPLMVGKWHVGENRGHWPTDRGFEHYFGLISGGCNYFRLDPGRQMALEGEPWQPPAKGFYMTDAFTEHAVSLLDDYGRRPEPFLLYLAYTAPHWPLHAWPEDIAKYRGKYQKGWDRLRSERHARQMEMGIVDKRWPLTPRDRNVPAWEDVPDKDDKDNRMAIYAAQITRMDQGIGRVLAKLREVGEEENTLVLFLSDNGACHEIVDRGKPGAEMGSADSFLSYGLGWANAGNTPFRLYKHWTHEGGIAAPLIARWPQVIRTGNTLFNQPAHITDIMPTVLDLAGARYPGSFGGHDIKPLAGKSLVPVFRGERWAGHDALFWEHEGNRAIHQGNWKLVSRYPDRWELYDLDADRTELRDMAAQEPARVRSMISLYEHWARGQGVVPWNEIPKPHGVVPGAAN